MISVKSILFKWSKFKTKVISVALFFPHLYAAKTCSYSASVWVGPWHFCSQKPDSQSDMYMDRQSSSVYKSLLGGCVPHVQTYSTACCSVTNWRCMEVIIAKDIWYSTYVSVMYLLQGKKKKIKIVNPTEPPKGHNLDFFSELLGHSAWFIRTVSDAP